MLFEVGEHVYEDTKHIIGIFDLDSITVRKRGREFFAINNQRCRNLCGEQIPLTLMIVQRGWKRKLYLLPQTSLNTVKRIEELNKESVLKRGNE